MNKYKSVLLAINDDPEDEEKEGEGEDLSNREGPSQNFFSHHNTFPQSEIINKTEKLLPN